MIVDEDSLKLYILSIMCLKEENDSDKDYEVYLSERKSLADAIKETSHQFDKAILTLSAGALAISLTFVNTIAPTPIYGTLKYLFISWSAFIVSILLTLISYITSQKACLRDIKIMEDSLKKSLNNKEKNLFKKITNCLNIISITLFIIGIITLTSFSFFNIKEKEGKPMAKEKSMTPTPSPLQPTKINPDGGYTPPATPVKRPPKVK